MHVVPVERDDTGSWRHRTADQFDQSRLSGPGRPDHRGQCSGLGGKRHVLQQLSAIDGQRQPLCGEPTDAGCDGLGHQRVTSGEQVGVANRDDVAVTQPCRGDQRAVDESPVAAVVVADFQTGRTGHQHRVHAGCQRVLDDDVVGFRASDGCRALLGHRPRRDRWIGPARLRLRPRPRRGGGAAGRNIVVFELSPGGWSVLLARGAGAATRNINCGPRGLPRETLRRSRIGITLAREPET